MRVFFLSALVALVGSVSVVACSETTTPASTPASGDASISIEAGAPDAPAADSATLPSETTSVDVTIGGVSRTLERAQFGESKSDAGDTLYIEAHEGGDPACPDESTPTPKRTVIVSGVPRGAVGTVFTKADGIAVSFLDFTGDQLDGKPLSKATAATVTIVAVDGTTSVEIDVEATFDEGTVAGRIYATYCASLSDD